MYWKHWKLILTLAAMLFVHAVWSQPCLADELIKGHYCYTYGDNESLREAKELTRTLAIRNAIESYRLFVESTTNVKNFQLTNDIVQMLSSGYLKNVKVLSHSEEGRTICETIQATVSPREIDNVLRKEISRRTTQVEKQGLDNNGFLKVLGVKQYQNQVLVQVKVLRNIDILDRPYDYVFLDVFDDNGNPIKTYTKSVRYLVGYDTNVYAGEIRIVNIITEYSFKSYRVWLQKPARPPRSLKSSCLGP